MLAVAQSKRIRMRTTLPAQRHGLPGNAMPRTGTNQVLSQAHMHASRHLSATSLDVPMAAPTG